MTHVPRGGMNSRLDDPAYRLSQTLGGFHRAKSRCDDLPENVSLDRVLLDLTEALWWTRCVDEGIENAVGASPYRQTRRRLEWRACKWDAPAADLSNHQRALTVEVASGLAFLPNRLSTQKSHVVWRPLAELPNRGRRDPSATSAYERCLAGRPVVMAVEAAAGWFATAQRTWPTEMGIKPWSEEDLAAIRKALS